MRPLFVRFVATSLLSSTLVLTQDVSINAPPQAPSSASGPVDNSFLGLMIECTSWPEFTNDLSVRLIENLVDKIGTSLSIRVGGTSEDQAVYDPNQAEAVKWTTPNTGLTDPVSLGPKWLDAFKPIRGVKYTVEVPLATGTLESSVDFAKAVAGAIDPRALDAFEIGNEPDLYVSQNKRTAPYGPPEYVPQFIQYSNTIRDNVSLPAGPLFQAGVIAEGSHGWTAPDLYNAGLGTSDQIKTYAMHHYQTFTGNTLGATLLNHTATVAHTTDEFQSSIDYLRQAHPNVPLVLAEAGSALDPGGRVQLPDSGSLDRVLGSALWEVDWLLLGASLGVGRVNMAQCTVCNFAAWYPVARGPDPPVVNAQYYGLAFVADFFGLGAASRSAPLQVASLFDPARPNLSPYAGYAGGELDRLAVIDLNEWNATAPDAARLTRTVCVDVPSQVTGAQLRRLTAAGGTSAPAANMTYAGTQWTVDRPAGVPVGSDTEEVQVQGGKATFTLKASEAVLVTLSR